MGGHKNARHLIEQEPGRENRYASNAAGIPKLSNTCTQRQADRTSNAFQNSAGVEFSSADKGARATHESGDDYSRIVAVLGDGWRVMVCKDALQWIVQRRKTGGAERPWRAVGYCRTRKALIQLCATSCGPIDAIVMAALAALPETFGGAA